MNDFFIRLKGTSANNDIGENDLRGVDHGGNNSRKGVLEKCIQRFCVLNPHEMCSVRIDKTFCIILSQFYKLPVTLAGSRFSIPGVNPIL